MFKKVHALVIKELWQILQDKKSRLVLILPPIMQLFIFAFAATLDVTNISMAVLNEDYGKLSYELVQRFKGFPYVKNITYLDHESQIKDVIENQKALVVLHIKEQFSRNLLQSQKAEVQLILDGKNFLNPAFLKASARIFPFTFVPVGSLFFLDNTREYRKFT